jgi:hypothetical protein
MHWHPSDLIGASSKSIGFQDPAESTIWHWLHSKAGALRLLISNLQQVETDGGGRKELPVREYLSHLCLPSFVDSACINRVASLMMDVAMIDPRHHLLANLFTVDLESEIYFKMSMRCNIRLGLGCK